MALLNIAESKDKYESSKVGLNSCIPGYELLEAVGMSYREEVESKCVICTPIEIQSDLGVGNALSEQ
jgi:hypothetical protein